MLCRKARPGRSKLYPIQHNKPLPLGISNRSQNKEVLPKTQHSCTMKARVFHFQQKQKQDKNSSTSSKYSCYHWLMEQGRVVSTWLPQWPCRIWFLRNERLLRQFERRDNIMEHRPTEGDRQIRFSQRIEDPLIQVVQKLNKNWWQKDKTIQQENGPRQDL